jgi:NADH-quinone oxidoreductase subunit E
MELQGVEIDEIMERYPTRPEYLIFFLQDIQARYGYISPETMQEVSDRTGVPLTQAYSVATFYQSFRLEPRGEHEIKVCLGTACHLKGGPRMVEEIKRRLDVAPGETTNDLSCTLSTVNCVGACALAPVVVFDDEYLPNMTARKLDKVIKKMKQELESDSEGMGHV